METDGLCNKGILLGFVKWVRWDLVLVSIGIALLGFVMGKGSYGSFGIFDFWAAITGLSTLGLVLAAFYGLGEYSRSNAQNLKLNAIRKIKDMRLEGLIIYGTVLPLVEARAVYHFLKGKELLEESDLIFLRKVVGVRREKIQPITDSLMSISSDLNPLLDSKEIVRTYKSFSKIVKELNLAFLPIGTLEILINNESPDLRLISSIMKKSVVDLEQESKEDTIGALMFQTDFIERGTEQVMHRFLDLYRDFEAALNGYETSLYSQ